MKQEEKQLLLKDLCARLLYGVKIRKTLYGATTLNERDIESFRKGFDDILIPYLRPMSSMTEEEKKELLQISNFDSDVDDICYDSICFIERTLIDIIDIANFISWLNAHHFDYRGLIERGLAIEVTKDNNPYKK